MNKQLGTCGIEQGYIGDPRISILHVVDCGLREVLNYLLLSDNAICIVAEQEDLRVHNIPFNSKPSEPYNNGIYYTSDVRIPVHREGTFYCDVCVTASPLDLSDCFTYLDTILHTVDEMGVDVLVFEVQYLYSDVCDLRQLIQLIATCLSTEPKWHLDSVYITSENAEDIMELNSFVSSIYSLNKLSFKL